MVNLRNPYDYEASLNNILHKAPLEAGVERVVITLLNDILSDLGKWPKLSAEDTPTIYIKQLKRKFELKCSVSPDGMILDNSGTYQQAGVKGVKLQPSVLIETKTLDIDPYRKGAVFEGEGAKQLLNRCKEKDKVDELSKFCGENGKSPTNPNNHLYTIGDMPDVNLPDISTMYVHWYDWKNGDDPNTDPAYDAGTEFTLTFKDGTKVKLYQLDWYLLDLYYGNCKYVIWTNGLVWKIFFIENGTLKDSKFNLDKNGYGYIPDGYTGNIQIDQNEFNALINYLRSIL